MARARLTAGGLVAALLFFSGALLAAAPDAVLGSDLQRRPCPGASELGPPPAAPKKHEKAKDATYDPWELVSV
jgi:hypothetical protein